jgi:hypothetical protein
LQARYLLYLYDEITLVLIEDWDDYGGRILAVSNGRMKRCSMGTLASLTNTVINK